jgi:membrane-bound lytic murein transglycosylase D
VAVQKAIEKTGYADFWMLHQLRALPTETENYVPIIIATALIAKDPQAYGFEVEPDPPIVTDRVAIGAPTDLRLVAQLIDRPVEEIVRLNPGLLRWTTPANDPEYVLRLPEGTGDAFEAAIVAFPPDKRIWWRAHKVSEGDTLASVARKFRISTVALASANNLAPGDPLTDGTQLMLPMAPGSEASLARVRERGSGRPIRYRIRRGDTLERIADRFDVTPYKIRRWNGLSSSRIIAGRTLRIYVAGGASASLQRARPRPSTSSASGSKTKRKATSTKSATGDLAKPRSAPMPSQPASGAAR